MKEGVVYTIIAILGIIAGFVARGILLRSRGRSVDMVAKDLGYTYKPTDDESVLGTLTSFPIYTRGYDRTITNVMKRHLDGVDVTVFDFEHSRYTLDRINPSKNFRCIQTVVLFETEIYELPEIELHPDKEEPIINGKKSVFFNQHSIINVESNENGMIIYEEEIKYPPEYIETLVSKRMQLFQLIIKTT